MSKAPTAKSCPVCRKPAREEFAPFCSHGCKSRDLLKWLGEGYRIPRPIAEDEADSLGLDSEQGQG